MFWGLKLEAEKQYSQLVEKPFHISQATLGPVSHEDKTGTPTFPQHLVEVHVVVEKTDYIICYLDGSQNNLQQSLDLRISEGEEIVLYCRGHHHTSPHETVYLTGYLIEEVGYPQALEDMANDGYSVSDFTEEEDDSGHEDLAALLFQDLSSGSDEEYVAGSHRALPPVIEEISEEGSGKVNSEKEQSGAARPKGLREKSTRKRKREEGVGTPEGKPAEEADSSSKKKQQKLSESKAAPKKATGVEEKQPKGKKAKAKAETSGCVPPKKKAQSKPVKLPSGTEILDVAIGEGKMAKPGKKVFVRYTGRLAHNNKIFDSNTDPDHSPFFFRLGQGEVIRGWDEGVAGMRVGGKRKLTIPPKQGYGAAGAPPTIPPHSKLIFEVELTSVK